MANGILGELDLAATTATLLFTGAAGKDTTCSINLVNRDSASTPIVRVALVVGVLIDLAAHDYIEYDYDLMTGMPLVRAGVVVGPGQSVVVYSSLANVTAKAWGFEQDAIL